MFYSVWGIAVIPKLSTKSVILDCHIRYIYIIQRMFSVDWTPYANIYILVETFNQKQ